MNLMLFVYPDSLVEYIAECLLTGGVVVAHIPKVYILGTREIARWFRVLAILHRTLYPHWAAHNYL